MEDLPDVMANISKAADWAALGVHEHTTALAGRLHEQTWFSSEHLSGVVQSRRGALAGTTLADIIFSGCMAKACCCAREGLEQHELTSQLQVRTPSFENGCMVRKIIQAEEASFVDDVVQPIIADADLLIRKVENILAVWHDAFRRFGFTLNCKKGKTNVVLQWSGDGAIAERTLFEEAGNTTIRVVLWGGAQNRSCEGL